MYSFDLADAVLKSADIVTVISNFIPVTKKGRNYVALCPFHDDKNPSLSISKEKQIFKCFVCGTGGNAITFVQKHLKCSYSEAVRKVAEISGFHDERLYKEAPVAKVDESKKRLYDCINDLAAFYRYSLSIDEGAKAREYLKKRNLDAAQQEKYGIGYAPLDGAKTIQFLQAKKHSLKAIDDIGIAMARAEGTSDHNAGRLIFPLHDPHGQVVGFSARQLEKDGTSKYINSPENPIFTKGNNLYNYFRVASSARQDGYCYLLEGFMDVMALDKAGIHNAVALMGTQLTPEQIKLLKRLRCEIRIGLDGDLPGQMAAMRTAGLLFKNGIPVRVVDYEGDLRDPDDILQEEGPEGLRAKMEHLVDPIEFSLAYYTSTKKLETAAERKAVLSKFLPYLRAKPAGIEYEDMLVKIAHATSYEPEAIRALAKSAPKEEGEDPFVFVKEKGRAAHKTSRLYSAERMLLYYMLQEPEALAFYESSVRSFRNSAYEEAANYIIEYEKNQESPGKIDLGSLIAFIESYGNGDEAGTVVSELAFEKNYPPYSLSALEDCLKAMKEEGTLTAEQMAAKRKIEEGTLEQGAEANKELAEKIRAKWNKKGAHHG